MASPSERKRPISSRQALRNSKLLLDALLAGQPVRIISLPLASQDFLPGLEPEYDDYDNPDPDKFPWIDILGDYDTAGT